MTITERRRTGRTSLRESPVLSCVLGLLGAPDSRALPVSLPSFPAMTLGGEISLLPNPAAAVWLPTDPL